MSNTSKEASPLSTGNDRSACLHAFGAEGEKEAFRLARASDHLTCDSREVRQGSTFIAIKGHRIDGHDFVEELGGIACVAIVEPSYSPLHSSGKARLIRVRDTGTFASKYAPVFYRFPTRSMKVIGITGTNGKTTVSYLLESLYRQLGKKTGVIGTVEIRIGDKAFSNPNTTPEPVRLQYTFDAMRQAGVDVVAVEISSHALNLGRVSGVELDEVIFTNVTPDHLDFHPSMEAYVEAKLKIFDLLAHSGKLGKRAIAWRGASCLEAIQKLCQNSGLPLDLYDEGDSLSPDIRTAGDLRRLHLDGMDAEITWKGKPVFGGKLPLIGRHNLLNLIAALTEVFPACHSGDIETLIQTAAAVKVPGRLEVIENDKQALIVVDYAHTSNALENVLDCLGRLPHRRLVVVFGCGGDRDLSKRPIMGQVVGSKADVAWVTSDNPRSEDPGAIIDMILPGLKSTQGQYEVVPDREEAITRAIASLSQGDILLVAGKGHETYQIVGDRTLDFDDRKIIHKHLS